MAELEMTDTVTVTEGAALKLRSILQERNTPDHGLRVFVAGGGCSGMQYGMAIDAQPRDSDQVFDSGGIRLFVDPMSLMYIQGATIDYVDSLMGGGFRIENPNAISTCGCGHSFRTAGSTSASEGGGCASC